ncbi:MAG: protein kinase [Deltaproteobacteria bacterium]|nr:protein kinase [Deltaproteobacteria bacterium]
MLRCPLCATALDPGVTRCPRDGVAIGSTEDPLVGVVLANRYRILARLARGGMATVYLATHILIGRHAAIKILRSDLCRDPVQRDRFLREARAVNRIDHENIVQIVDYGESDDGRIFLVMEYLPGESLHHRISRGVLPPLRALDIASQISSGLGRAHQMGVIHRDLKPDNVLLLPPAAAGGRDRVKLLDFGIAKLLDQPSLTASDKIFGTPGYIAPEYASGAPLDHRADLYSLGVVLFEMLTGELPFEAEFPADLLLKHMLDPPRSPRSLRADIPLAVELLVLRLLVKKADERFRDAFHLIEEIDRVSAMVSGPAPEITLVAQSLPSMVPEPVMPTASSPLDAVGSFGLAPPDETLGSGIQGARVWGRYLDALRGAVQERFRGAPPQALVAHIAAMDEVVGRLRLRVELLDEHKRDILEVESRGRDFRRTMGRAMDTLSKDGYALAAERDVIAHERESLVTARTHAMERAQKGEAHAVGIADALLWRIAASDEMLRDAVGRCEDVEFQLRELETQLRRLNDTHQQEHDALLAAMQDALMECAEDDQILRSQLTALRDAG